mgnify:CR=1 FL=1
MISVLGSRHNSTHDYNWALMNDVVPKCISHWLRVTNYANWKWHIGISVCNEFFYLNYNFDIFGLISMSRWWIRVCKVCLSSNFEALYLSKFQMKVQFFYINQRILGCFVFQWKKFPYIFRILKKFVNIFNFIELARQMQQNNQS